MHFTSNVRLKLKSHAILLVNNVSIRFVDDSLRKFVVIEGKAEEKLADAFNLVYRTLTRINNNAEEPMMNILSFFNPVSSDFSIIVFIRSKHRPACYFAEDDSKLLLSPAAVDIGGVCITPREQDFEKISKIQIRKIFREVFVNEDYFKELESSVTAEL